MPRNLTPVQVPEFPEDLVEEADTGVIISRLEAEIETEAIVFIRKMMIRIMIGQDIEEERPEEGVIKTKTETL